MHSETSPSVPRKHNIYMRTNLTTAGGPMKDGPHPIWRKSSHTSQEGGTCVELAALNMAVGVRDSTDPDGPVLQVGRDALAGLLDRIKTDQLDR